MSKEILESSKADVKEMLEKGELTSEEAMELGIWLTGKGIASAWTDAVEGLSD